MVGKDEIFDGPFLRTPGFRFDEAVANAFDDMLQQSVPFYKEVHA